MVLFGHARSPEVITHQLNVRPQYKYVKRRKRCIGLDRQKTAEEKVDKLLRVGFIREIFNPQWLANLVIVKKTMASGGCVLISQI